MVTLLPALSLFLVGLTVVRSIRREQPLECLPSVLWAISAVLPYLYLSRYFPFQAARDQAIGISLISVALAVGDMLATSLAHNRFPPVSITGVTYISDRVMRGILAFAVAYVVILPLMHIAIQGQIPFVTRLLDPAATGRQLSEQREQFSKLLRAPAILKIQFNWVLVVAAPFLVVLLLTMRRWIWALLVFGWAGLYAILSLATSPLVTLVFSCTVGLMGTRSTRTQRMFILSLCIGGVVWFGAGAIRGEAFVEWYQLLDKRTIAPDRWERIRANDLPLTPGDIDRLQDRPGQLIVPPTFGPHVDSFVRRTALVPMEVSNRWYAYFPKRAGDYRSMDDLLPWMRSTGWVHPANAVAQWGYRRLFPDQYMESTSAYASIDADAFARGGLGVVTVVAFFYALLRYMLARWRRSDAVSTSLYTCAIAALAIFPFQASLQAILISQGAVLFLLALLGWNAVRRLKESAALDTFPSANIDKVR